VEINENNWKLEYGAKPREVIVK